MNWGTVLRFYHTAGYTYTYKQSLTILCYIISKCGRKPAAKHVWQEGPILAFSSTNACLVSAVGVFLSAVGMEQVPISSSGRPFLCMQKFYTYLAYTGSAVRKSTTSSSLLAVSRGAERKGSSIMLPICVHRLLFELGHASPCAASTGAEYFLRIFWFTERCARCCVRIFGVETLQQQQLAGKRMSSLVVTRTYHISFFAARV